MEDVFFVEVMTGEGLEEYKFDYLCEAHEFVRAIKEEIDVDKISILNGSDLLVYELDIFDDYEVERVF